MPIQILLLISEVAIWLLASVVLTGPQKVVAANLMANVFEIHGARVYGGSRAPRFTHRPTRGYGCVGIPAVRQVATIMSIRRCTEYAQKPHDWSLLQEGKGCSSPRHWCPQPRYYRVISQLTSRLHSRTPAPQRGLHIRSTVHTT